jgi:hypothetical protein
MDKFIEFNGGVFNTRHIIALTKCKRDWGPQYCISMYVTGDIERQYFDNEYERDMIFNQISRDLLND